MPGTHGWPWSQKLATRSLSRRSTASVHSDQQYLDYLKISDTGNFSDTGNISATCNLVTCPIH